MSGIASDGAPEGLHGMPEQVGCLLRFRGEA
jgi:hypothetical protein